MLIRKNSNEYKSIRNLVEYFAEKSIKKRLIKLFIVKSGHSIEDKISIEDINEGAEAYYNLTYEAIRQNLNYKNIMLYKSDEAPNLYFFRDPQNESWDQTPFELEEELVKKLDNYKSLPPAEAIPGEDVVEEDAPKIMEEVIAPKLTVSYRNDVKQSKIPPKKASKPKLKPKIPAPKKPLFNTLHEIDFTDLEKVIFPKIGLTKKGLLDYYDKVSTTILPYLVHRPQSFKLKDKPLLHSVESLNSKASIQLPDWAEQVEKYSTKDKRNKPYFVCEDRDHLLLLIELGCVEIHPWLTRVGILDCPDQLIINLIPKEIDYKCVIQIARFVHKMCEAISIIPLIKTSEHQGFHIYIALNGRVDFNIARELGQLLCKLINLRYPQISTLNTGETSKVYLDFSQNQRTGTIISPYSIIESSESGFIATPVKWEEVNEGFNPDQFTIDTIFKRLEKYGDIFKDVNANPIDAKAALNNLQAAYSFLF